MPADVMKSPGKLLSLILYLIALHSFFVGMLLIIQPPFLMVIAGFEPGYERFFPSQGGVFHIVMAVAYSIGALNIAERHGIISFTYIVKFIATIFLLTYYAAVDPKPVILLSGIGDGLMGIMIYAAYKRYLHSSENRSSGV